MSIWFDIGSKAFLAAFDGHDQNAAGAITGLVVHVLVEALVFVRVLDDDGLTRSRRKARKPPAQGNSQFGFVGQVFAAKLGHELVVVMINDED